MLVLVKMKSGRYETMEVVDHSPDYKLKVRTLTGNQSWWVGDDAWIPIKDAFEVYVSNETSLLTQDLSLSEVLVRYQRALVARPKASPLHFMIKAEA